MSEDRTKGRADALAASLRANLARRKAQQRMRGEAKPAAPTPATADADPEAPATDPLPAGPSDEAPRPTLWRLVLGDLSEDEARSAARVLEATFAAEAPPVGFDQPQEDGPWQAECLVVRDAAAIDAAVAYAATALERAGIAAAGLAAEVVEDRDWVAESQRGLPPIRAGRFVVFGPHDRARMAPSRFRIEIEAARAFGTGHHATTKGCLVAIDRVAARRPPRRVLDVGTGSGVLAIAALLAGARRAVGTDIDPVAVRTARDNAALAGVGPRARFVTAAGAGDADARREGGFDLVLANILARPLIALAPALAARIAPGGALVLSGLRTADLRAVRAAYRGRGLVVAQTIRIGDWPTLILRRGAARRAAAAGPRRRRTAQPHA